MRRFAAVVRAVAEREFSGRLAYRFSFIFGLVSTLLIFVAVYNVGKLIPRALIPGGDYFTVTVIGIGIYTWVGALSNAPRSVLMTEMSFGTLEAITLMVPDMELYLLAASVYFGGIALLRTGMMLLVPFLLGWRCPIASLVMLAPLFLLSGLAGLGAGLLQTGLDLRMRRAGRIFALFGGGGAILSGVYFPVALLPAPFRFVSRIIPATHAIEAARTILVAHVFPLRAHLALAILAASFCLAGHLLFRHAERTVRRDGSFLAG